ncbi:bifunctional 4-hydroxy-2-oxoglutarate aldolase/2-dehydro-3-deoxy-phosphogluconate aldolase [Microbacterium schleiferi]|uniref:Bifunctional 4-hydroxy-2-oxoglutarate aldolase/2-dehydro-3-deoxy-phosphogluconate aldolase n=1 Tax=Microbacterium schleiferi TaxID=69362 RepID=A0A7S8MVK1_9MICO|nr:bifunctional 4-hydroxy-2-oxoglutarate aldolase/2-dehydro-3-deoxy-phosphogluconate aldolase [Microbacterium schleiferi]QPE03453.1 bifunctional 4-hydroxy-2-oxoglutarate aldolase/2-dehydro-3-deoxy-phosphogluconate aldolase [Microbacterium schleiferi]
MHEDRWPRPLPRLLQETPLIAVLRAEAPAECVAAVRTLVEEGIGCVEMTLTTPGVLDALPAFIDAHGDDADIGVGSIVDPDQAMRALDAGASFVVTPVADVDVVRLCVERGVPVFPGALSPTEIHRVWSAGASAVKVFPASLVGSEYLGQLRGPMPDVEVVPSGGVGLDEAVAWITAGARAVSVGGPLLGDSLRGGNPDALRGRARAFVATLRDGRGRG